MRIAARRRLATTIVLALTAALPSVLMTASPAAADSPVLGMAYDSEPGDTVGQGGKAEYEAPENPIIHTIDDNTVTFEAQGPECVTACPMEVTLSNGAATTWALGAYENAQKDTTSTTAPGLDVRVAGRLCPAVNGRFIVDKYEKAQNTNVVTHFTARFEQHCAGNPKALFGSVTYAADRQAPYYYRTVPNSVGFGETDLNSPVDQTVTITNDGPTPINPTGFSIVGPNASEFVITDNPCDDGPVDDGESCAVDIRFTPTGSGVRTATLNFFDEVSPAGPAGAPDTIGTGRDVALSGEGITHLLRISGSAAFGNVRVGTLSPARSLTVKNIGYGGDVVISDLDLEGPDAGAFGGFSDCLEEGGEPRTLEPGEECTIVLLSLPVRSGSHAATITLTDDSDNGPHEVPLTVTGTVGYWLAQATGAVTPFGDAGHFGDMAGAPLAAPLTNMTGTVDGNGYWLLGADGGIFSFGNAKFHGSMGGQPLNAPVLDLTSTPDGSGYWLVAADGGVFAFDAPFYGSMGGQPLNAPVVGIAPTPDGSGYWLVASDGGVFAFNAPFHGSMGGQHLNAPVIGIIPSGNGYLLVASDGGVFAFNTTFHGSTGGQVLESPMVALASTPTSEGYWLADMSGTVYDFGDAEFLGDLSARGVDDVVAVAGTAPLLSQLFAGASSQSASAASVSASGGGGGFRSGQVVARKER